MYQKNKSVQPFESLFIANILWPRLSRLNDKVTKHKKLIQTFWSRNNIMPLFLSHIVHISGFV